MNCYLDDNTSTDAISERLRDVCPSLFSNDDAVTTKVSTTCLLHNTCFFIAEHQGPCLLIDVVRMDDYDDVIYDN